jgi:sugar/nucleoside kinase (ribokinase family)
MKKILCIGGITADILINPLNRLPEPGTLCRTKSIRQTVGGCAANAAIDLARLGVPVTIACKVGLDAFGKSVVHEMQKNGVDTEGVSWTRTPTSASVVAVDDMGERSFIYSPGSTSELTLADIPEKLIDENDIIFIASALLLEKLDGKGAAELLKKAQEKGKFTVMDTVWDDTGRWMERIRPAMPYLDLFMPSIEEARELAGFSDPDRIADVFFDEGVGSVIIKMGTKGSYICESRDVRYQVPAFLEEHPADTNGAGDSFCAGFLCGLARGQDFKSSARFASAVGRYCVLGSGPYSGIPQMEEIDRFLEEKGGVIHE